MCLQIIENFPQSLNPSFNMGSNLLVISLNEGLSEISPFQQFFINSSNISAAVFSSWVSGIGGYKKKINKYLNNSIQVKLKEGKQTRSPFVTLNSMSSFDIPFQTTSLVNISQIIIPRE